MRFITSWLVVLFLAVASGEVTQPEEKHVAEVGETSDASLISSSTEKSVSDDGKAKTTENGKPREKDKNDLATDKDMTLEDFFLVTKMIEDTDKIIQEQNQKVTYPDNFGNSDKADDIADPENPIESEINKDFIYIRRQEENPKVVTESTNPGVQFDDSKTEGLAELPPRYGQRSRKFRQKVQDNVPLLQLTQGGYERPYKRPRNRNHYSPRPDSSDQSENVQQSDRTSNNKKQDTRRIVPQVTYTPSQQPSYALDQGPFMNPPFDSSERNMLAINQIIPPSTQNGFVNSPPAEFTGYTTSVFQPQFAPGSDISGIPNFSRETNNVGLYQPLSNNPYQSPGIIFQNSPQIQPQSVFIDAGRNGQTQLQQNPLPTYSGYETVQDGSTPNYASFFRNPAISSQFQIPPNFYGNAPNAINPFNNPPISFLSQYPNFDNRLQSQFFRYPDITTGVQNNQQLSNNQQFDSDAVQDENKAKLVVQTADKPVNRDDSVPAQFRTGLQSENIANVYMRYPTVEAGYAVEENMPALNNSDESKDESKRSNEEQTNSSNIDPNKNVLNSAHSNQRINNSFEFPPEFFRSAPIDFGYQRPQDGIFTQYPDRNRVIPNYPSRNFESRIPFNAIASLPENFLGVNNQQYVPREATETPSCAKGKNASVCFEDNDYPKNDILYNLNSNSFLTDRLLSPEPALNSLTFVERNVNETEQSEENYACDVATKYGIPLRAKNLAGMWRIIVNLPGRFSQPVRMEVCKTLGSSCSYTGSRIKTECVQKFSPQRLLSWSPSRGIYSDVYKIPVACSCQIIQTVEA